MILILSDDTDLVTNKVIRWLVEYNIPFTRITKNSKLLLKSLIVSNKIIDFDLEIDNGINKCRVKYSEITAYWYRRSHFNITRSIFSIENMNEENLTFNIKKMLQSELDHIRDYIFHLLSKKIHINNFNDNFINKQIFLDLCIEQGLAVPTTLISSCRDELYKFSSQSDGAITKAVAVGSAYAYRKTPYHAFIMTELVDSSSIKSNLPKILFPSLMQRKIDKIFEIRSFYLDGKFYSSAIFSQSSEKTKIDFRNYDSETPNRVLPYNLPSEIETSLDHIMKGMNINSGSFDIIYGTDGEFYILEVNPIGQFLQVSYPCNYNLEKTIAKYLSGNEKK